MTHRTTEELDAALPHITAAPADHGTLTMIVRRPAQGEREMLTEGQLDTALGLVGDNWGERHSKRTDDGSPHPDMQLNVMSTRVIELLTDDADRRQLAGDQLYLDMDISEANMPPGTRLAINDAVIEVTDQPHTGCAKFSERFGIDAARWVNSAPTRHLRLRGLNAKVVVPGAIVSGSTVSKVAVTQAAESAAGGAAAAR
jgi:MOSC domain-containing protein YiiM